MNAFYYVAFIAIIIGGVVSAFTARQPARFTMWLTAYLVLVVGVVQFGLVYCWQMLDITTTWQLIAGFCLYNIGNIAVMSGRYFKGKSPYSLKCVYSGGVILALAMVLLIIGAWAAPMSFAHISYTIFAGVILVSMPIGLTLSARSKELRK